MMKHMTFKLGKGNVYLGMEMWDACEVIDKWLQEYKAFKDMGAVIKRKSYMTGAIRKRQISIEVDNTVIATFTFSRPTKVSIDSSKIIYRDSCCYLIHVRFNVNNLLMLLQNRYKISNDALINWIISCGKTNIDGYESAVAVLSSIKCGDYKVATSKTLLDNIKSVKMEAFKNRGVHWDGTNTIKCTVAYDNETAEKIGYRYMLIYRVFTPIATAYDYSKERNFIAELDVCVENMYNCKENLYCS